MSTTTFFTRNGNTVDNATLVEGSFKPSTGTASYKHKTVCGRCGGAGNVGIYWVEGGVCFACGGTGGHGMKIVKCYTEEKLAKLNAAKAAKDAIKAAKAAEEAKALQAKNEALLDTVVFNWITNINTNNDFLISMSKAAKDFSLTEKQVAAIKKAYEKQITMDVEKTLEIEVPEGKTLITGEIISIKAQQGWGYNQVDYKMLVKVVTEEGIYKVFGSLPKAIFKEAESGMKVEFTATLKGKETGFGFFSRPTKARII